MRGYEYDESVSAIYANLITALIEITAPIPAVLSSFISIIINLFQILVRESE